MARLEFDFHARPAHPGKLGMALAIAGAAALVWAWSNLQAARAAEAGLAAHIARIEQARPQKTAKLAVPAESPGQAARAHVASQMDYSWEPAFAALAAARSGKIALVSLEAAQAKPQIKLVAEARHLADAVAFIDALQQQPGVKRAALVQHEVRVEDAQKPVRFNIMVELGT
ncbi:MAG: hypothetical protein B7X93_07765 [Hydrogenophilales bacterium 17-61-9]|nr:MAG: hypothetical protein B7X93_07765 [Hydrogenophilales bacterium 17-61-9]